MTSALRYKRRRLVTSQKGDIMIMTLVFVLIFVLIATGLLNLVSYQQRLGAQQQALMTAFELAEAGTNYYRWHLAHDVEDYADGTGAVGCNPCGPYVHEYTDPSGGVIGSFSLMVTPPEPGSTIVKVRATGWAADRPETKRQVAVSIGQPSLAAYTTVVNSNLSYGSTAETYGPVHSNGGVKFDGVAHNIVTSALEQYWYGGAWRDGVWTSQPDEGAVFLAGTSFPVPAGGFAGFTQDLNTMESAASSDGVLLNPSGYAGYHVQFQTGTTFRYRIVATKTADCNGQPTGGIQSYAGDWLNLPIPDNGLIFVKDDVWVDGTIDQSRTTVVAAREPLDTGTANIYLNTDLLYTSKAGADVIGLIAQNNVIIGLYSEDDLELDAIIIAKNGRRYRPDYGSIFQCGATVVRDAFTLYGSTISNLTPYMSSGSSGYSIRDYIYDPNTLYAPPPFFPTTGEYDVILWEEVLAGESS